MVRTIYLFLSQEANPTTVDASATYRCFLHLGRISITLPLVVPYIIWGNFDIVDKFKKQKTRNEPLLAQAALRTWSWSEWRWSMQPPWGQRKSQSRSYSFSLARPGRRGGPGRTWSGRELCRRRTWPDPSLVNRTCAGDRTDQSPHLYRKEKKKLYASLLQNSLFEKDNYDLLIFHNF